MSQLLSGKLQLLYDALDAIMGYSLYLSPTNNKITRFRFPCIVLKVNDEDNYVNTSLGVSYPLTLNVSMIILNKLNDNTEETKLADMKIVLDGMESIRETSGVNITDSKVYAHIENNTKLYLAELKGSI